MGASMSRRPWASLLGHTVPWLVGVMLLPGLWSVHNGVAHGYWGVSKTGVSFACSAYGEPYLAARVQTRSPNLYDKGDLTAGGTLGSIAKSIGTHPASFARAWLGGLGRTLLGPGEWTMRKALLGEPGSRPGTGPVTVTSISESDRGLVFETGTTADREDPLPRSRAAWLLILWSVTVTVVAYLAALRGAIAGLRRRDAVAVYCTLALVLLALGSSGYQANARFRVPMVPFLALLAATPHTPPYRLFNRNPSLTASRSSSSRNSG